MGSQPSFAVRFRRRAWLALLLPVVAGVQACYEVAHRGGVDLWTIGHLVGKFFLIVVVGAQMVRILKHDVLTADADGLVLNTLLWGRAVVPWESVTAVRAYRAGLGRRIAVEVPDPEAILPVSAEYGMLPARLQARLARSRHGRLTVPLLLTDHRAEQVVEPLARLADTRCPVLLEP